MIRTLLLSNADKIYLHKCAQAHKFAYGIIVAHEAEEDKCIAVHLARNNEEDGDLEDLNDVVLTVDDISPQAVASQWLAATKMCPGSFFVKGMFVSSVRPEIINETDDEFKNSKKLLADITDLLNKSETTFGPYTALKSETDYIFLAYSTSLSTAVCKSYTSSNNGTFTDMACRFVEKPFEWITIECNYELDEVYPIFELPRRINIESQFHYIVEATRKCLIASEIFFQNEPVENNWTLQAYCQNALENRGTDLLKPIVENNVIKASMVLPVKCILNHQPEIKVREFGGTLLMTGLISSRIFCNPHNKIYNVKRYIRDDVLRSLLTRVQIYCDGLTDPHVSNDALYISEPPRRVYFSLPVEDAEDVVNRVSLAAGKESVSKTSPRESKTTAFSNPVQFSEYIFRGEAPTVAVAQAKQILDIDIDVSAINLDIEALAPDDLGLLSGSTTSEDDETGDGNLKTKVPKRELSRSMYMLGISVALLVLFLSIALHYIMAR